MLGKIEDNEKSVAEDKSSENIIDSRDMNLSKLWEIVKDRGASSAADHGVPKSRTGLSGNKICNM